MQRKLLATMVACGLSVGLPAYAAGQQNTDANDQADVQKLTQELQTLKANYAAEVRRLRELDMQVQALQARLNGQASNTPIPAQAAPTAPAQPEGGANASSTAAASAGTQTEANEAQNTSSRSVSDALQENANVYTRKWTIENGLTYSWYDRNQLTLNGFLALDAIFLGNIALQEVKSSMLTYDFTTRYGVTPRLTLSVDVPYVGRQGAYFQGGAGGAAAATQEESSTGTGIGDVNFTANYKLFTENGSRPDTVLTLGAVAPTGTAPYGIYWETPGNTSNGSSSDNTHFAIPDRQPTGNGLWQALVGTSVVKTLDPAIVFANLGYIHSFSRHFSNIDTNPQTPTPGSVELGDSFYYGAGVAFAFNERTSLSLAFSDKISEKAWLRTSGEPWTKVTGSEANAATLNMGLTYALTPHTTIVTLLGIGLTPDAPNYTVNFKIPYMF